MVHIRKFDAYGDAYGRGRLRVRPRGRLRVRLRGTPTTALWPALSTKSAATPHRRTVVGTVPMAARPVLAAGLTAVAAAVSVATAGQPTIVHPASNYWQMAGAGRSEATAGFSFFTRIFSLFEEGIALDNMQMGMGGTWLTPTNISWGSPSMGDTCACNPKGWPSASKGDPAFGCCEKDTRCSFLYETFEGGPGYWIGQLPTQTPKWRVNSAVGCYRDQTATPLFNFGAAGKPHPCDSMGIAQLSNRLLMAPDGLTFELGKEGMVGVSYARTPLGKVHADDDRNFWTILVDTLNFAGPLGYFIPEFWSERWDSPNPSPGSAALGDLGKAGHGLSMGGGAFEWNTLYNYKMEDKSGPVYKVPRMALPLGPDGETTLFKDARGYSDEDIYDPLEAALTSGSLNASRLMVGGRPIDCKSGAIAATYRLEGGRGNTPQLVEVGQLKTTVDAAGNARWSFAPNATLTPNMDGKLPEFFGTDAHGRLVPIDAEQAPSALVQQQFAPKKDMGPYDGLSHPPAGGCDSQPGPAEPPSTLHCAQTSSPSWIAYRWYKFVPPQSRVSTHAGTAVVWS
eukprot:COSAG01_NODE_554_length_15534_cov_101.167541_4_plen_567_part_00